MSTINIQQKRFLGSLSLLLLFVSSSLELTGFEPPPELSTDVSYVRFDTTPVNYEALKSSERFLLPSDTANKWRLDVELLNWNIKRSDLDFAGSSDQTALAIGHGTIHQIQFDENQGFRGLLAFKTKSDWELGVRYTSYGNDSFSSLDVNDLDGTTIFSTRSHSKVNEEAETAVGYASFYMNSFDFEARKQIVHSDNSTFEVFGGLRWGEFDQVLQVEYDGHDFNQGEIDNKVNSNAFGLFLGGAGSWNLGQSGYYASFEGNAALLTADKTVSILETELGASDVDVIVDVKNEYDHLLPTAAFRLGAGYRTDKLDICLSYEITGIFNLADRLVYQDDIHESIFSHSISDVTLEGLTFRLQYRF